MTDVLPPNENRSVRLRTVQAHGVDLDKMVRRAHPLGSPTELTEDFCHRFFAGADAIGYADAVIGAAR
jgi:hypothetical protein